MTAIINAGSQYNLSANDMEGNDDVDNGSQYINFVVTGKKMLCKKMMVRYIN